MKGRAIESKLSPSRASLPGETESERTAVVRDHCYGDKFRGTETVGPSPPPPQRHIRAPRIKASRNYDKYLPTARSNEIIREKWTNLIRVFLGRKEGPKRPKHEFNLNDRKRDSTSFYLRARCTRTSPPTRDNTCHPFKTRFVPTTPHMLLKIKSNDRT